MSERDGYQAGVPCWVDTLRADPEATARFYAGLFGWTLEDRAGYLVCSMRGRDVAAVGLRPAEDLSPAWNSYVWVDNVDDTVAKALGAGGGIVREPFDSFDGGRMTLLSDPAGAVFGVWQPGAHRGAQLVNEPSAWAMSLLSTPDVDGAKRFYGAVFGWETEPFEGGFTMWRMPGYFGGEPSQPVPRDVVAVMVPLGDDDRASSWSMNFWVADADEVAAKAAELGGKVIVPPSDRPGFREAVVADPEGVAVSVSQLVIGA